MKHFCSLYMRLQRGHNKLRDGEDIDIDIDIDGEGMYFIGYENKLVQIFKDRLSQVRIIYILCKHLKDLHAA